jgi:hypothetical protein
MNAEKTIQNKGKRHTAVQAPKEEKPAKDAKAASRRDMGLGAYLKGMKPRAS